MTNKIVLRTREEVMAAFQPTYNPILGLFLPRAVKHTADVGQVDFKKITTVGDVEMKDISPKDTEIKQINVGPLSKSFKKYFKAKQYIESNLQSREQIENVTGEVLDANNKLADKIFLSGDGTANNNVINNGLIFSADANHTTLDSVQVEKETSGEYGPDLCSDVMTVAARADLVSGRKVIMMYGTAMSAAFRSLFTQTNTPVRRVIQDGLGDSYAQPVVIPQSVLPSSLTGNGFLIVSLETVRLHYMMMPELMDQGINAEKMYAWMNFLMGSFMLEVEQADGVIHQPVTFEE